MILRLSCCCWLYWARNLLLLVLMRRARNLLVLALLARGPSSTLLPMTLAPRQGRAPWRARLRDRQVVERILPTVPIMRGVVCVRRAAEGLGWRVWDVGFGVWGLGFRVWGLGFRVWGLGIEGAGFRI